MTTKAAAALFGITTTTLWDWIRRGVIAGPVYSPYRTTTGLASGHKGSRGKTKMVTRGKSLGIPLPAVRAFVQSVRDRDPDLIAAFPHRRSTGPTPSAMGLLLSSPPTDAEILRAEANRK
jgi:hypothetical protein